MLQCKGVLMYVAALRLILALSPGLVLEVGALDRSAKILNKFAKDRLHDCNT